MNIKHLIEGYNINSIVIKSSVTKTGIIISSGEMKEMQDKQIKFTMMVELDEKQWNYTPNKESIENIAKKYGVNTEEWVGKKINFITKIMQNNKEGVIAVVENEQ